MQSATALQTDNFVPLEAILCTEELQRRPSRPPDYATENRALVALAQALAESPETILQKLADTILEIFQVHSAGLSLLTQDGTRFYWPAIAGAWKPHIGGGTQRDFGPCGDVLDRNAPLLFKRFERRYPYLLEAAPAAEEALLLPFYVHGKAVGTIWAMAHDHRRQFDAEDLRQMESLGRFASAAYQAVHLQDSRRAALNLMEDAVLSRQMVEKLNRESRESERRFRQMIDALPVAIYTTDAEGRLTHFNPAAVELSGRVPELGTDRWCVTCQLYHPDGTPMPHEECPMAIALKEDRAAHGMEAIAERPDGKRIWFEPYPTPLHDADGRLSGGINMLVDITERKRSEDQLRSLNQDLQHFVYAASHDLQQPLRMVTSYTQLLARRYKGKIDERAESYIAFAVEGAQRMETLLRDLRDYWSLNKETEREPVPTDCNEVLEEALSVLALPTQETGGSVTHDPLPTVTAERITLTMLFQNLVGNALKYGRPDQPPRIHVSAERSGRDWIFSVRDNGIGIEPEYLKEIFAPFKRLHGSEPGGSGLGLAICKKVVDRYGGKIWAESEYGRGAAFRFTIPA
ncbi:MAG: ATP-binding protein [Bryobacteraceae bacterium]